LVRVRLGFVMDVIEEIGKINPVIGEELDLIFCNAQPSFRRAERWLLDFVTRKKVGEGFTLPEAVKVVAGAASSLPDVYECGCRSFTKSEIVRSRFSYLGLLRFIDKSDIS